MIIVGAGIVIGGLMAWLGVIKGVFVMAATAFNILISIYTGLLSTPLVLKTSPGLETSGYYAALCMLFLMAGCFVLLQGICYYFFFRGADIVFPTLFDKAGGGLLGFVSGYVLTGIVCLAVCMMPFSRLDFVQQFLPSEYMESFCGGTTTRVCHVVSAWSLQYLPGKPEQTIAYLLSLGRDQTGKPASFQRHSPAPPQPRPGPGTPPVSPKPAEEGGL